MSVITSQQIAKYYSDFQNVDVTFTKDVIRATLLYAKNVQIRCLGYQWPVLLYSSSMSSAKVIANIKGPLKEVTSKAKNMVQLRFSFIQKEKTDPITFFINSKIVSFVPYNKDQPDLNFINLVYTNRPPDELIYRLGTLLEANASFQQRREERIPATPETLSALGIDPKNVLLTIEHIPRRCIIRDLSFSGMKVIIMGFAQFLVNKPATIKLGLTEQDGSVSLSGKVIRFEQVQGRKDLAAFAIQFDEKAIPAEYKLRISNFLKTIKKSKPQE
ncbi:PilZ domain-containing protein [Spirochaeta lutea]|uniref:Pilus assembly protein PilZ n=1 Tax=Spirochaeta lutea TaxID=1480694 RepID=A0A098R0R3_9SPIO|nr:PilZ domain-containing protein [Spirochaeta lutea]KGE73574.1 pilus assembly protein PilZ [Spirochaeta lutea]